MWLTSGVFIFCASDVARFGDGFCWSLPDHSDWIPYYVKLIISLIELSKLNCNSNKFIFLVKYI